MIDSAMLRLLWTVIEDSHSQDLLTLSDTALIAMLMQQISRRVLLSGEEVCSLYAYLSSKLTLIRDMADFRRCGGLSADARSFLAKPQISEVLIPNEAPEIAIA